jgi:CubicO group peptidase (beta-lactamase class C family)
LEEPLKSLKTVRHLRQTITHATVLAACQLAAPAVWAHTEADPGLQAQLEARYKGDMSGACVMVAIIEGTQVRRARYCALPEKAALPDWNAAFEIGSITKTMTAFLVSDLIAKGKWSLDDPIALHLPKGTQLPRQGERQILVRDLLTHSSGLPSIPSRMRASNPEDPWADLTEQEVLDSLGDVKLGVPIGSTTAYSNFGMAVVSLAVSRAYGTDYETALRSALFEPLGMKGAYTRWLQTAIQRHQSRVEGLDWRLPAHAGLQHQSVRRRPAALCTGHQPTQVSSQSKWCRSSQCAGPRRSARLQAQFARSSHWSHANATRQHPQRAKGALMPLSQTCPFRLTYGSGTFLSH